jgi:hypothetical protein
MNRSCFTIAAIAAAVSIPLYSSAQKSSTGSPDTAVSVAFGAFVDGYYAYDFGRPRVIDRPFTTQAVRHNEFNVNLAYVEAKL